MLHKHLAHEGIKLSPATGQTPFPYSSSFEKSGEQPPRTHGIHEGSI